jgi:hypothetical protein
MSSRRRFLKLPPLALAAGAVSRAADALGQDAAKAQAPAQPRLEPPPTPVPAASCGPAEPAATVHRGPWVRAKYDTYIRNPLVEHNEFLRMEPEDAPLPAFESSRGLLPVPFWDGHASTIECYWRAWQLAFSHLMRPEPASGFVANFIDTAFDDCLFLWDSCFILMFGRYGGRAFPFIRTLDNLYAKQHPDGFICRQIGRSEGEDRFFRYDPDSTGPNVLAWAEWEHYRNFGDRERLARVFPVLRAYHQWLRAFRTWPDGSYFSSGWGCGMDNQPRLDRELPYYNHAHSHGWMSWVDSTLQQVLSARLVVRMARELGVPEDAVDMREEDERLSRFVNAQLWDDAAAFYFDRWRDGRLNGVKTIGAYWALIAGVVPGERLDRFVAHLEDPRTFNRSHRVPSLAADTPGYQAKGDYWRGGVWASTNYMVLRGLTEVGRDALAHEIARNHVSNVVSVFEQTGTLWENYAPESASPGDPARRDFVGWGGLPPIGVFLEYVLGLRPDAPARRLVWDVRLTERHGVRRYPFGADVWLDLSCAQRRSPDERPRIEAKATAPIDVEVRWGGRSEVVRVGRA